MSESIKVSIIIVSFNSMEVLDDCLKSLMDANLSFNHEVIIVDNASIDGSQAMIRRKYPQARLILNRQNNLFAKANNQGAEIAGGEYLLLLNSDTLVKEGQMEKLVEFLDNAPENIACVGPLVLNVDGSVQSAGFALPSICERIAMVFRLSRLLPRFVARRILPIGIPGLYQSNHVTGWVAGCCMLIRHKIYSDLGGLHEGLEFYGEEPEFCWRLRENGYQAWMVHDAFITHLGGKSSTKEFAGFLDDHEGKLRRYTALQRHTVGIKKAIIMSHVVLAAARLKYLISGPKNKKYFGSAIEHEKSVIDYMKRL